MCNRGGNCHVPYLTINWLELKSTPHSCTLKHRTTILISSTHHIINSYSKLFIVATPNKTIKILPYLVTRVQSPLLVHISRSIDAFATAKQPYESSWSVQSPETIEKCSFTFSRAQEPRTWDLMRRNLKSPDSIFRLILFFGDDDIPGFLVAKKIKKPAIWAHKNLIKKGPLWHVWQHYMGRSCA